MNIAYKWKENVILISFQDCCLYTVVTMVPDSKRINCNNFSKKRQLKGSLQELMILKQGPHELGGHVAKTRKQNVQRIY